MTQVEKYELAIKLLKELNCPDDIMDILFVWGFTIRRDETKLKNWVALSQGGVIEGEAREVGPNEP